MEKFIAGLLISIGAIATVALFSVIGGTIVFWIWPVAIPGAFPGLVASGVIAGKLGWWTAVCLTWLAGILWKATQTNNNK